MIIESDINIKNRIKNITILFLRIFIALIILILLIKYINFNEITEALRNVDLFKIILVLLLTIPNIYFQYLKWKLMCNHLLKVYDKNKIWQSLFFGFTGGIITPIRIGEYAARMIPFNNSEIIKITVATFIEKMSTLIVVIILGSIGTAFYLLFYYSNSYAIYLVSFLVVLLFISVLKFNYLKKQILNHSKSFKYLDNILIKLNYLNQLSKKNILTLFIFSSLFYFVYILQFALLVNAFNLGGNILLFIWAGIVVMFLKNIFSFLSFADLGIRESASVFVLSKMGIINAVAFNAAIFMFFFNLILPSFIGLLLILRFKK